MYFLGDVKNPVAIGKKKDLWKNLDNEFYEVFEIWRWFRIGMLKLNIQDLPCNIAIGIRTLCELTNFRGF
ncbi:MAG: hypothetical protein BV457_00195 [Thermoplasmata archaeon M9B1D]|nr:MAG: hypothetical protein BV457_00195 [Thermoplasmata archaeon M9B1D]PNX52215.1 MAG: hypothetical protein BV456_00100 [Thermoplasmata archaeon M8B2D]